MYRGRRQASLGLRGQMDEDEMRSRNQTRSGSKSRIDIVDLSFLANLVSFFFSFSSPGLRGKMDEDEMSAASEVQRSEQNGIKMSWTFLRQLGFFLFFFREARWTAMI